MKKGLLALLLAAFMLAAAVPTAFAAGATDVVTDDGYTYTLSNAPTAVKQMVLPAGFEEQGEPEKTVTVYVVPPYTAITPRTEGLGNDPIGQFTLDFYWKENGVWRHLPSARFFHVDEDAIFGYYLYEYGGTGDLFGDATEEDVGTLIGDIGAGGFLITLTSSSFDVPGTIYLTTDEDILPEAGKQPTEGQFSDVPADAYYADAVAWAVENNITSGTSATTFSPDVTCTRSQAVTFLWRAAGSPEPTSTANPFVDVSSGQYYYKAVLWAVEKGITSGTSSTTFSPDQTCSRSQIVTLQWRAAGQPSASGSNFSDVPGNAFYAEAVAWAVENGITSGTGNGTFSPDSPCTRAQIVTFLYRDMAE